ncbi:osmosensitive K+ channel Signal transduction histidine kinase [Candidatus Magnetoovum chiemensis]|nr:osmosensitive K+ channel Signal transduction histidine kinase [Candidatus Magnetoovum chiemensis]
MSDNDLDKLISPDNLLEAVRKKESRTLEGKLKIFIGMAAGVGKTYAMVSEALAHHKNGIDIAVGLVETHKRKETQNLLRGLPVIKQKEYLYKGMKVSEIDIDAIIKRKPKIALIDELAHTNISECRHNKRYQDVLEILSHGIDVHTCVNIQHIESLNDQIRRITGVRVLETVPDSFFDRADEIVIIDLPPVDLLQRLREGKIYLGDNIARSLENFFKEDKLSLLRETALRFAAERVNIETQDFRLLNSITGAEQVKRKLMVGIFSSPYSEMLIRCTRRLAQALSTNWIGVYVDTDRELSDEEKELLEKNMNFVRQLGGEVVIAKDNDVVNGILRAARRQNVTQIIVGKSRRNLFSSIFAGKSLIDRLFRESREIDIYMVCTDANTCAKKPSIPPKRRLPKFNKLSLGLLFVSILTAASFLIIPQSGYRIMGYIYIIFVTLSATYFPLDVVIVLSILCGVLWNFFFIPPRFTFTIAKNEDWMLVLVVLITASIAGILTSKLKKKQKLIIEREEKTNALYQFTKQLSVSKNLAEIIENAAEILSKVFQTKIGIFVKNDNDELTFTNRQKITLSEKDKTTALWVYHNRKHAGKFTDTLPVSDFYFTPLNTAQNDLGVLCTDLSGSKVFTHQQQALLSNFANQLTLTIEKEILHLRLNKTKLEKQSELIFKTLMDSVSHELKTPLSTIHGCASALLEPSISSNPNTVAELANEIVVGSRRMNSMVQNLLDMSRIESGQMRIVLSPVDLSDLIGVSIEKVSKIAQNRKITVYIDSDTPLMNLDFVLFEQAVTNILTNACLYTQQDGIIKITVKSMTDAVSMIIEDNGLGIPLEYKDKVFDKFFRANASKTGGTGLGLTIARSIIELHKAGITAQSVKGEGAKFIITLPKEVFFINENTSNR